MEFCNKKCDSIRMNLLDGKKVAEEIATRLKKKIKGFELKPTLAVIQIGELEESNAYIGRKKKFGEAIGAFVRHIRFSDSVVESELFVAINNLNKNASIHGIILQLPIPSALNRQKLLDAIAPEKDVDGLTSTNVNCRKNGKNGAIIPATARGIVELLEFYKVPIQGRKIAVLGRSALVGTPTAEALKKKGAIVSVCHSKTPNTKGITRESDIVVVAIGKSKFIGADYFGNDKTQVVVDVGITAVTEKGEKRLEEEIPNDELIGLDRFGGSVGRTNLKRFVIGDVDFEAVKNIVSAISPVPGGVGPMTVASLFQNLAEAYEKQILNSKF